MVKSVIDGVTTYYVGGIYELEVDESQAETERKYYSAGSKRIAMRVDEELTWLLSDHLGSTSVTANATGGLKSKTCYTAFGETRPCPGVVPPGATPTDYLYTGQRQEAEIGLYFYNSRFYDPALARFTQADTIIPGAGNPLSLDRYAYVKNNPLRYVNPSGHYYEEGPGDVYIPPPPPMPGGGDKPEPRIPWNSIAYELSPEAAQQLINDIDLMLDFINIHNWLSMGIELAAGAQSLLTQAGVRGLPVFSAEFFALATGVTIAEAGTIITAMGLAVAVHTIPALITADNLDTLRDNLSDLDLDVHGGYVVDEIFVIYHNVNVYSQKGHRSSVVPEVYPVASYLPTFLLIWSTVWRPEYFD